MYEVQCRGSVVKNHFHAIFTRRHDLTPVRVGASSILDQRVVLFSILLCLFQSGARLHLKSVCPIAMRGSCMNDVASSVHRAKHYIVGSGTFKFLEFIREHIQFVMRCVLCGVRVGECVVRL